MTGRPIPYSRRYVAYVTRVMKSENYSANHICPVSKLFTLQLTPDRKTLVFKVKKKRDIVQGIMTAAGVTSFLNTGLLDFTCLRRSCSNLQFYMDQDGISLLLPNRQHRVAYKYGEAFDAVYIADSTNCFMCVYNRMLSTVVCPDANHFRLLSDDIKRQIERKFILQQQSYGYVVPSYKH
jgi:hypothetical protein